jgi:hypothetical protein
MKLKKRQQLLSHGVISPMRGRTVDHGQFSTALPRHFPAHPKDAGGIFGQGAFLRGFVFMN